MRIRYGNETDYDENRLELYTKTRSGEYDAGQVHMEYILTEPVILALTGQTEELERMIGGGMPPLGINREIAEHLEGAVRLQCRYDFAVTERGFDDDVSGSFGMYATGRDILPSVYMLYTTPEAAMLGGHYDTFRMLQKHGAVSNMRGKTRQKILCACRNEEIIRYVLEHFCPDPWLLTYEEICREYGWNLNLLSALYDAGYRPDVQILNRLLFRQDCFSGHETAQAKRHLLESPLGQFLTARGYRIEPQEQVCAK